MLHSFLAVFVQSFLSDFIKVFFIDFSLFIFGTNVLEPKIHESKTQIFQSQKLYRETYFTATKRFTANLKISFEKAAAQYFCNLLKILISLEFHRILPYSFRF